MAARVVVRDVIAERARKLFLEIESSPLALREGILSSFKIDKWVMEELTGELESKLRTLPFLELVEIVKCLRGGRFFAPVFDVVWERAPNEGLLRAEGPLFMPFPSAAPEAPTVHRVSVAGDEVRDAVVPYLVMRDALGSGAGGLLLFWREKTGGEHLIGELLCATGIGASVRCIVRQREQELGRGALLLR